MRLRLPVGLGVWGPLVPTPWPRLGATSGSSLLCAGLGLSLPASPTCCPRAASASRGTCVAPPTTWPSGVCRPRPPCRPKRRPPCVCRFLVASASCVRVGTAPLPARLVCTLPPRPLVWLAASPGFGACSGLIIGSLLVSPRGVPGVTPRSFAGVSRGSAPLRTPRLLRTQRHSIRRRLCALSSVPLRRGALCDSFAGPWSQRRRPAMCTPLRRLPATGPVHPPPAHGQTVCASGCRVDGRLFAREAAHRFARVEALGPELSAAPSGCYLVLWVCGLLAQFWHYL